jgi:hypothetical protein
MKEDILRNMIRKQIKSSLKEVDVRTQVGTGLEKVSKMAGVKMLKNALGQGSPDQQAAGLLAVVQAISGNSPIVARKLAFMLKRKGLAGETPDASAVEEGVLDTKSDKLDKTQAMKMLKQALGQRPANQQSAFVIDLINKLDLKEPAKKRLVMTIRKNLK